jgi:hypothetical protein
MLLTSSKTNALVSCTVIESRLMHTEHTHYFYFLKLHFLLMSILIWYNYSELVKFAAIYILTNVPRSREHNLEINDINVRHLIHVTVSTYIRPSHCFQDTRLCTPNTDTYHCSGSSTAVFVDVSLVEYNHLQFHNLTNKSKSNKRTQEGNNSSHHKNQNWYSLT